MDTSLQTLHGSILSLHASIESFRDPPWLHLNLLKLLNFNFNADTDPNPDPAFHSNANPHPASQNNADPDPQPCLFQHSLVENNPNFFLIADSRYVFYIKVTVLFLSVLCRGEEDDPTALERSCRALSSLAHHSHARRCHRIFRV